VGQPIDTATVLLVSDASGFARQVKLQVDEALRGIASQANQAFAAIERDSQRAGTEIGQDFQRGGERAEAAFRETSATARREFAEIDVAASTSAAGMSSKLGGALAVVKTGLLTLGAAAGVGLVALTGFGLKSAASLEQSTVAFTSLLHSADQAKSFLSQLQTFAAETPFEFKDVVGASQRLLVLADALGQTKDAVIPMLTTIGDLVSVTGGTPENIDSIVRALGQMSAKGKITQEEMMQLSEALPGFNANAAIASELGLSVADTLTLITAGGVDATTGINALLKGMAKFPGAAGAMAAQSQTLTGVFSTFKDTIGIALTGAFQPVIPDIKSALSELTPVIGQAIGTLAPSLGGALSAILPILGKLITAIVPILSPILDALGPVLDAIGPSLIPLGEALGQLIVALAPILPVLAQFIAVLAELAIPIIKLLAAVLTPLTPVLNYMALAIGEVAKALGMIDWTAVGAAIGGAFASAWRAVSEFAVNAAKAIFEFGAMLGTKLREFIGNIVTFIEESIAFWRGFPGRVLEALGDFGNLLVQKGRDLIAGLWAGIQGMGGWLWGKITGFIDQYLTGSVKAALGINSPSTVMRGEVGMMIPPGIGEGIQAGIPNLAAMIGGIMPGIGEGIQAGIPNLAAMIGGITPGASGATNGGGTTIGGGINVTINFVGGTPTVAEATKIGQAAGDGITQALARRNVGLAVSMGVSR
jgi:tape measure domain-containing protein